MRTFAGSFLVAKPALDESFFGRTVILLLQHGEDGAFGLIVNKPSKNDSFAIPMYIGGPCKFQGLIMIHGQPDWVDELERESAQICPGIFLGNAESLKRITDGDAEDGWRYRVFAGYSGWGPGQLENELGEGSWFVVPAKGTDLFDLPLDEMWVHLMPSAIPQPSMN